MNKDNIALTADEIKILIRLVDDKRSQIDALGNEFGFFSEAGKELSLRWWQLGDLKMNLSILLQMKEEGEDE